MLDCALDFNVAKEHSLYITMYDNVTYFRKSTLSIYLSLFPSFLDSLNFSWIFDVFRFILLLQCRTRNQSSSCRIYVCTWYVLVWNKMAASFKFASLISNKLYRQTIQSNDEILCGGHTLIKSTLSEQKKLQSICSLNLYLAASS